MALFISYHLSSGNLNCFSVFGERGGGKEGVRISRGEDKGLRSLCAGPLCLSASWLCTQPSPCPEPREGHRWMAQCVLPLIKTCFFLATLVAWPPAAP